MKYMTHQVIVHTLIYSGVGKVSNINNPQAPACFEEHSLKGVITITEFKVGFTIWSTHPCTELTELLDTAKFKNQIDPTFRLYK